MAQAYKSAAKKLLAERACQTPCLPVRHEVHDFVDELMKFLFPHYGGVVFRDEQEVFIGIRQLAGLLGRALLPIRDQLPEDAERIVERYFERLPEVMKSICADAQAIYDGDPAAESVDEVVLAYPGFFAIAIHRLANALYEEKVPFFPRIMTEYAHRLTGVDIHPGAQIGQSFCIDHGTSVVIGETTVIGNRVKIYQGVTLGALSVEKRLQDQKRHPTIEDDVVIYANATILGGETVIGERSVIGGNVWLTRSVPADSKVYYKSELLVEQQK